MGFVSTLLVAAIVLAMAGACAIRDLESVAAVPGDLRRERQYEPPERQPLAPDAGATERALYAAAQESGQDQLLIVTEDPRADLLDRARACDGGKPEACGRLAGLFTYLLGRPELGSRLWADACGAGHLSSCAALADLSWRPGTAFHDPEAAFSLDVRSCTRSTPRPHTCRRLAEWVPEEDSARRDPAPAMPVDRRLLLLDRACVLGDEEACLEAASLLRGPPLELGRDDPLVDHYESFRFGGHQPDRQRQESTPPTPGEGVSGRPAEHKRNAYAALLQHDVDGVLRRTIRDARTRTRVLATREACRFEVVSPPACPPGRNMQYAGRPCPSPEYARCARRQAAEVGAGFALPRALGEGTIACARECTTERGTRDGRCVCSCLATRGVAGQARAVGARCMDALGLPAVEDPAVGSYIGY